ncbi:MAG: DUF4433 domain-containing protein [Methylococcales bacterium]|nr:DUF4433 domain-containing protein [Methylococcales bacterium]
MDRGEALTIISNAKIATINHMTHINNLDSIFKHGLLSHNNLYKKVDISNQEVNSRRNKIEPIYHRNIHDYVPLYFNPRNAMLYRNQKIFKDYVVVLAFDKDLLLFKNSIFTNGNAASNNTLYFNNINCLSQMKWDKIWSRSWNGHEDEEFIKWSMMAEVLIYEKLEITKLIAIYCSSNKSKQYIDNNYQLGDIEVSVNRHIFF